MLDGAFCPDLAAVATDDALDDRQADAVARKLLHSVQALESPKELVGVIHVKAGPVVTNEVCFSLS